MCCNIQNQNLFAPRGQDQVQEPLVRGESLFAHHQPLLLHPPVLKPDFDLLVAQVQPVGELLPFLPVDELIHQKLVLKFSQLRFRVGLSLLPGLHL